jgi:lysine N6-hydroxylase
VTTSQPAPHFHTVGVGAGPANLSLAALYEAAAPARVALFEARPAAAWHEGLLFTGVRMQTMWLKDLVSLVDPRHRLSFLCYLVRSGRVYTFLNAQYTEIPRLEYANYLAWAASRLSDVYYGKPIEKIRFDTSFMLYSGGELIATGDHLVIGVGSRPRLPAGLAGLDRERVTVVDEVTTTLRDCPLPPDEPIAVVGGGQSGAECVLELRRRGFTDIRWFGKRSWFAPLDDSPSANELFRPAYAEFFHSLPAQRRRELADEQILTSDGVAVTTLRTLFQDNYEDLLRTGRPSVTMFPGRRVVASQPAGDGVLLRCDGMRGPEHHQVRFVVVAAGRRPAPLPFDDQISSMIETDEAGLPQVDGGYMLRWKYEDAHKIFVQNRARYVHGLQDSNLSLLARRSAIIINEIFGRDVFELSDEHPATAWG